MQTPWGGGISNDFLGLETNKVSVEEIKIAYREQAKKYHPDLNAGDNRYEERLKDINEAYKNLSDANTRRKYDRMWYSRIGRKKNKATKQQEAKKTATRSEILNVLFGIDRNNDEKEPAKQRKSKVPVQGEDVETEIPITIYEGFFGQTKKISLRTINGKMKNFEINIPAGIRNGEKVRLIGQGKPGENGGKNGDLLIKINIEENKIFKLYGSDLCTDLKLSPWEAALGTRVDLKTIDGETKVYVPQGIQSGEKIRIPSKGYKDGKGGRGDLVAEIKIMVPKKLELDEQEMFKKLKDMSTFNPRND